MIEPRRPRPRRRFGQHFLHDRGVIERIVSAIDPRPGERVVEIGPGEGALTEPLRARVPALDVVEIDRDLAGALRERHRDDPGFRLHEGDALRFDFGALADGAPLKVVGNLPYNISTPLLFHLLGQADRIVAMVFMLQREVAERITAAPGTGAYGRLSVMVQYRCRTEWLFGVAPGCFRPPPRVHSAVLRLTPRGPAQAAHDPARLADVVRLAFGQRRKTLRNSLMPLLPEQALRDAGVDPARRPETLSVAEFVALANACPAAPAQKI